MFKRATSIAIWNEFRYPRITVYVNSIRFIDDLRMLGNFDVAHLQVRIYMHNLTLFRAKPYWPLDTYRVPYLVLRTCTYDYIPPSHLPCQTGIQILHDRGGWASPAIGHDDHLVAAVKHTRGPQV